MLSLCFLCGRAITQSDSEKTESYIVSNYLVKTININQLKTLNKCLSQTYYYNSSITISRSRDDNRPGTMIFRS